MPSQIVYRFSSIPSWNSPRRSHAAPPRPRPDGDCPALGAFPQGWRPVNRGERSPNGSARRGAVAVLIRRPEVAGLQREAPPKFII